MNITKLSDYLSERKSPCPHDDGYTVDMDNGDIFCNKCNQAVSPSHAVIKICQHYKELEARAEEVKADIHKHREILAQLESKITRRTCIKRIEQSLNRKMLPCCPHCMKPMEPEQIRSFHHRDYVYGGPRAAQLEAGR